jgi:hypothetical protein
MDDFKITILILHVGLCGLSAAHVIFSSYKVTLTDRHIDLCDYNKNNMLLRDSPSCNDITSIELDWNESLRGTTVD